MKAKLLQDMSCRPSEAFPQGIKPAGTIVSHPDAWKLVNYGAAEPADDECRNRITRSPEELLAVQVAYQKVSAGIHPNDYEAFDRGLMVGYKPDGTWIPGPNFDEEVELADDEDDEEEDGDDEDEA